MALKISESDLKNILLKNPNLSIHSVIGKKNNTLPYANLKNNIEQKSKGLSLTVKNVFQALNDTQISYKIEENGLLLVFMGAKILSRNQTDTLKERKKSMYLLIKYKKLWRDKVKEILLKLIMDELFINQYILKEWDKQVFRIYLYRETTTKLYDEDNLTTSFKYLIDGLRQKITIPITPFTLKQKNEKIQHFYTNNPEFTLISDDNQKVIKECISYQVKGKNNDIAIRLLIGSNKQTIHSLQDFCELK